jgi:Holliday junction resolvasome RuvABC endonuclease subunit
MRGGVITIVRMSLVHGVARLVLARHKIPWAYVPVPTLKKYATGSGSADKHAMINACRDVGVEPKDDNEADAAWLRLAGIHRYDRLAPSPAHALSLELISGPRTRVKWPALTGRR